MRKSKPRGSGKQRKTADIIIKELHEAYNLLMETDSNVEEAEKILKKAKEKNERNPQIIVNLSPDTETIA